MKEYRLNRQSPQQGVGASNVTQGSGATYKQLKVLTAFGALTMRPWTKAEASAEIGRHKNVQPDWDLLHAHEQLFHATVLLSTSESDPASNWEQLEEESFSIYRSDPDRPWAHLLPASASLLALLHSIGGLKDSAYTAKSLTDYLRGVFQRGTIPSETLGNTLERDILIQKAFSKSLTKAIKDLRGFDRTSLPDPSWIESLEEEIEVLSMYLGSAKEDLVELREELQTRVPSWREAIIDEYSVATYGFGLIKTPTLKQVRECIEELDSVDPSWDTRHGFDDSPTSSEFLFQLLLRRFPSLEPGQPSRTTNRARPRRKAGKKPSLLRRVIRMILLAPLLLVAVIGILIGILRAFSESPSNHHALNETQPIGEELHQRESEPLEPEIDVQFHRTTVIEFPTESRVWKSVDGREFSGKITKWNPENRTIDLYRADGEVFEGVPIDRFSAEDQVFLFGE